jgi:hypothetical protein
LTTARTDVGSGVRVVEDRVEVTFPCQLVQQLPKISARDER